MKHWDKFTPPTGTGRWDYERLYKQVDERERRDRNIWQWRHYGSTEFCLPLPLYAAHAEHMVVTLCSDDMTALDSHVVDGVGSVTVKVPEHGPAQFECQLTGGGTRSITPMRHYAGTVHIEATTVCAYYYGSHSEELGHETLVFRTIEKQEKRTMTIKDKAALLIEDLKTVGVQLQNHNGETSGSSAYSYKTTEHYEVDDWVVVKANGKFKLGKVVEIHKTPDLERATQWVVGRVDFTYHDKMVELEERIGEELVAQEQRVFREQAREALSEQLGVTLDDINKIGVQAKLALEKKESDDGGV